MRPLEKHAHACSSSISVVTNMVWMYGPTWPDAAALLRRPANAQLRAKDRGVDLGARAAAQLVELRRNVVHDAVADVHVLLGEADPRGLAGCRGLSGTARAAGWWRLRQRPSFKHYMQYIGTSLLGRSVVLVNQDIFAEGWERLPRMLAPPRTALLLSRYHRRVAYGTRHSAAAAWPRASSTRRRRRAARSAARARAT